MAKSAEHKQPADFVPASLNYLVDTGEKPVSVSAAPGATPTQHTGRYEERAVAVHNGRPIFGRL